MSRIAKKLRKEANAMDRAAARGHLLVQQGLVQIIYLDNIRQVVLAKIGNSKVKTNYKVKINCDWSDTVDYCPCGLFKTHKFCEHTAAVVELLNYQQRPAGMLFDFRTDDQHFRRRFPDNYLELSAHFEALLQADSQQAAVIFANKQLYDRIRAEPEWQTRYLAGRGKRNILTAAEIWNSLNELVAYRVGQAALSVLENTVFY